MQGTTVFAKQLQTVMHEDNSGCVELCMGNQECHSGHTWHISIKFHHFKDAIKKGTMVVKKISTKEQLVDLLTKPLEWEIFTLFVWICVAGDPLEPVPARSSNPVDPSVCSPVLQTASAAVTEGR